MCSNQKYACSIDVPNKLEDLDKLCVFLGVCESIVILMNVHACMHVGAPYV